MNPTAGDVHVNRPLTNMSLAIMQSEMGFVATRIFPMIPVQSKSDLYFTYPRGEFNRDEMQKRAPSTESAGGGYDISTDNYTAEVFAFHKDVDDQIRANADSAISLDTEATKYVTLKALIKREKLWATKYFATSVWGVEREGVASSPTGTQFLRWDDAASTPIEDIEGGKTAMLLSTGFKPNKLVLGYKVWAALRNHPDLVDRIKFSGGVGNNNPAVVNQQTVAAVFGVDEIEVMSAVENTAKEGQAAVHNFIGGNNALLTFAAPSPGLMVASAGYTFGWTGLLGSNAAGSRIKRFRLERESSDRVEIEIAFDQKLVSADLGSFFLTAVS